MSCRVFTGLRLFTADRDGYLHVMSFRRQREHAGSALSQLVFVFAQAVHDLRLCTGSFLLDRQ